ncbi:MAG: FtsX-like permease family protein [Candidatus Hodarchaeales archaeon]|jgi:ABC-type antimicrobial peptide transport system permease subunit
MPESLKKIYDLCYLSYRLITNNRKALLATVIGLVIATTVIAASSMLVESYNTELIDELLYPKERNDLGGEIQIDISPTLASGELEWLEGYENFPLIVNNSFEQAEYQDYYTKQSWFGEFLVGFWREFPLHYSGFQDAFLRTIEPKVLSNLESYLNPGGRLPNNYTEIIVVMRENDTQLEIGQQIFVGLGIGSATWAIETAVNVTIVGILDLNKVENLLLEHYFLEIDPLLRLLLPLDACFLLTSMKNAVDLMTPIMNGETKVVSIAHGKIFLDRSQFSIGDLSTEKIMLNALFTKMNDDFVNLENKTLSIDVSDIYGLLDRFEVVIEDVRLLQILLLLIDIPVIAITVYFVGYSYSLIKRQKRETIGILKTRGGSWQQVAIFLIGESIVVIGITLICGFVIGYFVTGTFIRSVNFLDFSGEVLPVKFSASLIQTLFLFVIIITIILNVSAMIQYIRMTIQESIIPVERLVPFWRRYYLDVIATLLGIAGYIIINEIGNIVVSSGEFIPLLPVIFLLVGVPTPFLLFFGSILLIARLFPVFVKNLAQFLWKRRGKLGAFALRNVVRHKEAASQAVILITLAISYTIISGSLAISVDETKKMEYYYYTGADLKVNIVGEYSDESLLSAVQNVSGVSRVTQTFFANTPSETGTQYYIFCFVDPQSFAEIAFFDEERFDISSPLTTLMEKIADNHSIILFQENLEEHPNLEIDDLFGFHFYNKSLFYARDSDYRNYSIVGTFNLWPQYQEYEWAPADAIFAIGSIGMFYDLNKYEYVGIHDSSILCELESTGNPEDVYDTVRYLSIQTPHTYSAKLDYQNYLKSVQRRFMMALLNTALFVCMIISVLGTVMFSLFTYLERGKEIGVERALGMTRIQTAILFTIEGLSILFFGLIIGFGTGIINTTIFLLVTQMGRTIPPIVVAYPFDFIFSFLAVVIFVATIGTLIIAYKATKKDISRVLKVE